MSEDNDKEQGPERVWLQRSNFAPDKGLCGEWEGKRVFPDDIEYIRFDLAQPVADAQREQRIAEIRELISQNTGPSFGYTHKLITALDYLLSCIQLGVAQRPHVDDLTDAANKFLMANYACTVHHHLMHVLKEFIQWYGSTDDVAQPSGELTVDKFVMDRKQQIKLAAEEIGVHLLERGIITHLAYLTDVKTSDLVDIITRNLARKVSEEERGY